MSDKTEFLRDSIKFYASRGWKGYDHWFPTKVRVVSAGDGNCVCELTVDEDLVNVNNHLHGACTAAIVDFASTLAQVASDDPYTGVSVELSVSYMAAAKLGDDIVIDVKTIKTGKTLAFLRVNISRKSDGAMLAVGKHTKYVAQGVAQGLEEILKSNL